MLGVWILCSYDGERKGRIQETREIKAVHGKRWDYGLQKMRVRVTLGETLTELPSAAACWFLSAISLKLIRLHRCLKEDVLIADMIVVQT